MAFYLVDWSLDYAAQSVTEVEAREKANLRRLASAADLVFVIEHEVHVPCLAQQLSSSSLCNVYWIMAGIADAHRDRIIPWQYHLWRIRDLYESDLPHLVPRLDPYRPKPFYFDAMLGTEKGPRSLVHAWIQQADLQHKIMASLGPIPGQTMTSSMLHNPAFFVDPDWQPLDYCDYLHLNQHVKVEGRTVQMPCLMPLTLYSETAYSIICETGFANHTHMITEKTAKAMIARRLFVMFAGAGFLRYMREQGFRTFEGIIDESYDTVEDDHERWQRAFDQVKRLCELDQAWVLERSKPVLEHNYLQVMTRDLTQAPVQKINQLIQQYHAAAMS